MFRTVYGNNKILNTKLFINQLFLINFLFVRIVSEFNLVKYKSRTEMLLKVLKVFFRWISDQNRNQNKLAYFI